MLTLNGCHFGKYFFDPPDNALTPYSQVDMDDGLRIWRSFKMGKLMDLLMLDTRHYDRSITDLSTIPGLPGLSLPTLSSIQSTHLLLPTH